MYEFRTFDLSIGWRRVKQSKQKAELGFFSVATQKGSGEKRVVFWVEKHWSKPLIQQSSHRSM